MRRVQLPAVIAASAVAAALYAWAVVVSTPTHPGAIGMNLNALGTDWMAFYGAAQWFSAGHLGRLFDSTAFTAYLNATFAGWLSQPMPFRPWLYPPSYLLALLPFGALPFAASYVAFQLFTGGLLAAGLCCGADRPRERGWVVAAALLCPAAAFNFAMGQNAFLTAALLVAGFRLLPRRPAAAGAVLGALAIKPQLGLLVPLALVAGREWRALVAAVGAGATLVGASVAVFGVEPWRQWLRLAAGDGSPATREAVAQIRIWGDSLYACALAGGASPALADAVQAAGTLLGAILVFFGFRRNLPADRKLALLLAAAVFAAPHTSIYELVLLAVSLSLWGAEAVFRTGSLLPWILALALWLAPLVSPPVVSPVGRATPLLILAFIGLVLAGPCGVAAGPAPALTAPRRPLVRRDR